MTATRLQLRAGPGEAYQPVVSLKRGERVVVLGKHGNTASWLRVEVPQGYHAWVFGRFLALQKNGKATVTVDRLLVRPRPTTRYHQLNGRLAKGEVVTVESKKIVGTETWYRVVVPRRFPLYAFAPHLRNIGPAKLAEPQKKDAPKKLATSEDDKRFQIVLNDLRVKLTAADSTADVEPLRHTVQAMDSRKLSFDSKNAHVALLADMLKKERTLAITELRQRELAINESLEEKLKEIEDRYKQRLREIDENFGRRPDKRYVAMGIVQRRLDLIGRYPLFRLEEGGRMRYFLIAPDYDLARFVGKRVGVTGLTDPESGTGYHTIMVKRIEILGDK